MRMRRLWRSSRGGLGGKGRGYIKIAIVIYHSFSFYRNKFSLCSAEGTHYGKSPTH